MRKRSLVSIFLSILIVFSLVSIIFVNSMGFGYESPQSQSPSLARASGDFITYEGSIIIDEEIPHENKIIYLNGNLTIANPGVLKLVNSTLRVNSSDSDNWAYKITIKNGGRLELLNESIIKRNDTAYEYELHFEAGSKGYLKDSTISGCGELSEQGLLVESDEVTFINCTFDKNYIGINYRNATSIVTDCEFEEPDFAAIMCNNSIVKLQDCSMEMDSSQVPDHDLRIENGSIITLLSTPLPNTPSLLISDNSLLKISWRLSVSVFDGSGKPLENATVNITDKYGGQVFLGKTNELGKIDNVECVEYVDNGTGSNISTPHSVVVTLDGYEDRTHNPDITENSDLPVTLVLKPSAGSITGVIKNTAADLLEGINVTVEHSGLSDGLWNLTNPSGVFIFTDLPADTGYTVTAKGTIDGMEQYETLAKINITVEAGLIKEVNFALEENELPVSVEVQSWVDFIDAKDAEDVDIGTRIIIKFDFPIDDSTIDSNSIYLKQGATVILGALLEGATTKEWDFSPTDPLDKNLIYTLTITKDVQRTGLVNAFLWKDYIISFETEINPVEALNPADQSIDVDPYDPNIFVRFNDRISLNQTSLRNDFILLNDNQDTVAGDVNLDHITKIATFVPTNDLLGGKVYKVILSDGVLDASNNLILRSGEGKEWTFTTEVIEIFADISGHVVDKKTGVEIENATVKLYSPFSDTPLKSIITDETGFFEFTDLTIMEYRIEINIAGYDTIEETGLLPTNETPNIQLGDIELSEKKEGKDDDEEEGIDMLMLGIIFIIVIIVILIILFMVMRKPKEEGYEDYEEEAEPARVSTPSRASVSTPSYQPSYRETFQPERAITTSTSMNRCPMCAHRLNSAGECFRCNTAAKYGL